MKTITIIICICFTANILLSQIITGPVTDKSDWFEPAPKGFNFVPQGSFMDTVQTGNSGNLQAILILIRMTAFV